MINYKFMLNGKVKELNAKNEGIFIKTFLANYPEKGDIRRSELNIKRTLL